MPSELINRGLVAILRVPLGRLRSVLVLLGALGAAFPASAGCWKEDLFVWNCSYPTATWQSPLSGAVVGVGVPVALTVYAQVGADDPTGASLQNVQFQVNGTTIGTISASNGSAFTAVLNWTPPAAGTYTVRARAVGGPGETGAGHPTGGAPLAGSYATITVRANAAPAVGLTTPANGSVLNGPTSSIAFAATASDSDGSINRVEFLSGGTIVGTSTNSPYQFTWSGVPSGTYSLSARAFDNDGSASVTSPVSVRVNALPSVAVGSNVSSAAAPATFALSATASDPDGSIASVQWLANGSPIGTSTTSPYTLSWSGVGSGAYSVVARATDNNGQQSTSSAINLTVNSPPSVALTQPANGAVLQGPYGNTVLAASASDPDGSINRVEFWQGGGLIGQVTSAPYQLAWNGIGVGTYTVFARAYDNAGAMTQTGSISMRVNGQPSVTLTSPANGAVVTLPAAVTLSATASDAEGVNRVDFYANGALVSTRTTAPYSASWSPSAGTYSVVARVVDSDGVAVDSSAATIVANSPPSVSITAPANGSVVQGPLGSTVLVASASDADGSVANVQFWLNGVTLIGQVNAPPYQYAWNGLGVGTWSVTARATDNRGATTTSAPISIRVNAQPAVSLTGPSTGTLLTAPASVTLTATASDAEGLNRVEFLANGGIVGSSTTAPYTFAWSGVAAGNYSLQARAVDNDGGVATSSAATLVVNALPSVALTAPANGTSLREPAAISMTATASDSDGSVTRVDFEANGVALGSATTAPYAFSWSSVPAGTYALVAKAVDDRGAIRSSSSATVTVVANAPPSVSLTSPGSGASYTYPASVSLQATASDSDGSIAKVEFFAGSFVIGQAVLSGGVYTLTWNNESPGTYSVFARATDNDGEERDSSVATVTITGSGGGGPPAPGGSTVGTLPGQVSIDPAGAAKYEVALALPPGTAGVVPTLSLAYNSQGGDSILGHGWTLNGFSSITRCGKTRATDAGTTPGAAALKTANRTRVNLNATDEFCLDGQRLVLVSGTHGAAAVYRTEIDNFSKVVSFGSNTAKGPDRWEVWTKAGTVVDYGATADSYLEAQGKSPTVILSWSAGKVRDRRNNYYTISYSKNLAVGELYPTAIRYTGNSGSGGFVPYHAIRLVYDAAERPDVMEGFVAGSAVSARRRLNAIQVVLDTAADGTGGVDVREYRIRYRQNSINGRSLVEQIQDCARPIAQTSSAYDCMPASTFEYSQRTPADMTFDGPGSGSWGGPDLGLTGSERTSNNDVQKANAREKIETNAAFGDFNGDGRTDVAAVTSTGVIRVCLSTGSGFNCNDWSAPGVEKIWFTGDFNGDGATDFVTGAAGPAAQPISKLCLSTRSGFNCTTWTAPIVAAITVLDIDADGRDDLILLPTNGSVQRCLSQGAGFSCAAATGTLDDWTKSLAGGMSCESGESSDPYHCTQVAEGQFDGSGRIGKLHSEGQSNGGPAYHHYCQIGETGVTCQPVTTAISDTLYFSSARGPKAAAINHDGADSYSDVVLSHMGALTGGETCVPVGNSGFVSCWPNRGPMQAQVCRSTGNEFSCRTLPTPPKSNDYAFTAIADVDGDGRPDGVMGPGRICQLEGATARCDDYTATVGGSPFVVRTGDFDGDGRLDFAYHFRTHDNWTVKLAGGAIPDLLIKVTNGFGSATEISYASLRNTTAYTPDSGAVYPTRDVIDGTMVVREVLRDDGRAVGGRMSTTYKYGGAKVDLSGRGFLGFRWFEAHDGPSNVKTRTEVSQQFPTVGMPLSIVATHVPSGVEVSRQTQTLADLVTANASGVNAKARYPYVSSRETISREMNGGGEVSRVTVNGTTVNAYGDIEAQTTTTLAGGESFTESIAATYSNTESTWLLGLPTQTLVTRTSPGHAAVTRQTNRTYSTQGELSTEVLETTDTTGLLKSTTTIGRDSTTGVPLTRTLAWTEPSINAASWTEDGTSRSRVVETLTYDTRKRYVATVKNAKNHLETRVVDQRHGTPTSITDPNLLVTTQVYDGFGRLLRTTRPDQTYTTTSYTGCSTNCGRGVVWMTSQSYNASNVAIAPPVTTIADSLGRVFQWTSLAFDGRIRTGEREFDAKGRLARKARTRFSEDSPIWTYYAYDDLARTVSTTGPTGTATVAYAGLQTTFTNEKNQNRVELRNALGSLNRVTDHLGGQTNYQYEPFGALSKVTDALGNAITVTYDKLGRKTQLSDPNLGTWSYVVNALGEVRQQTDAKAQATKYRYEALGRLQVRLTSDQNANWTYDNGTKALGRLYEAYTLIGGSTKDYQRLHTYDSLGRPLRTTTRIDIDYIAESSYDGNGRLAGTSYRRYPKSGSSGVAVDVSYGYNERGYLQSMASGGTTLWTVNEQDALDRVVKQSYGNGIVTRRDYNANTARLSDIVAGPLSGGVPDGTVQSDHYEYDDLGNLTLRRHRNDVGGFVEEAFGYDGLNRMTSSQVSGQGAKTYGYNAIGNITSKAGVGTYTYPTSGSTSIRPSAVTAITGTVAGLANPTFTYDDNGNLLTGLGRTVTWSAGNMPATLTKSAGAGPGSAGAGSVTDTFVYGPELQRIKQIIVTTGGPNPGTTTHWYGGGIEKETRTSDNTTHVRMMLPQGVVLIDRYPTSSASVTSLNNATRQVRYYQKDRLGSTIAVTNEAGAVIERNHYDAWGKRRNADGTDADTLRSLDHRYGFTEHEHIDAVGLVNMNGRVYDPILARFMSADPTIPDAGDGQNLNRFTYVLNSPLNYSDPSGFAQIREAELPSNLSGRGSGALSWFLGVPTSRDTLGQIPQFESECDKKCQDEKKEEELKKAKRDCNQSANPLKCRSDAEQQSSLASGMAERVRALVLKGQAATQLIAALPGLIVTACDAECKRRRTGGRGSYDLGERGAKETIRRYEAQGFEVIDVEVTVVIPGVDYERRYDFLVRSPTTRKIIGVEVKSTERGILRLDSAQVNFDTVILLTGKGYVKGATTPVQVEGVKYEGVDFTSSANARFQQGFLYRRLQAMGAQPNVTKAPD